MIEWLGGDRDRIGRPGDGSGSDSAGWDGRKW